MDHVLSFNTSTTKQCHNITILDDDNCECNEYFVSSLSTSDYKIEIDVPTVTICISDDQNDSECRKLCVISNISSIHLLLYIRFNAHPHFHRK